jgi:bacterioferritin-associated ferredoxin
MSELYHHKIPDSFRFKEVFSLQGRELTLYLDTNSKDKVEGLYFTWSGPEDIAKLFSAFSLTVEGLSFGEFPDTSMDGLYAPGLFYRHMLDKIKRGSPLFPYAKNRDPKKLICRCFGVYEEDVHELFGAGLEVKTIKDLGDHLQAGVGCGSCHHDLKTILEPLVSAPVAIPDDLTPELPLWQKLDTDSFARLAFQEIKDLKENDSIVASLLGTRPGGLLVKVTSSDGTMKEAEELISKRIEDALGKGLDISFQ